MTTLTRLLPWERVVAVLGVTALVLVASLATAPRSEADICENFNLSARCRIVFGGEKGDGKGGGGKGATRPPCNLGAPDYDRVPCDNAVAGSWSNERQCYIIEASDQPTPDDPEWRPKGKLYQCTGFDSDGTTLILKDPFWSETPPRTSNPDDLIADLETAVGTKFRAMYPGLAPNPIAVGQEWTGSRMAPVGLWVWMWPRTMWRTQWGPVEAEAEGTPYWVKAGVTHVKWQMGDGSTIVCQKSPPFAPWMRDRTPECGHKYKKPGNYRVFITTYWQITYVDANGPGEQKIEFKQSLWIRIGENQVVNK